MQLSRDNIRSPVELSTTCSDRRSSVVLHLRSAPMATSSSSGSQLTKKDNLRFPQTSNDIVGNTKPVVTSEVDRRGKEDLRMFGKGNDLKSLPKTTPRSVTSSDHPQVDISGDMKIVDKKLTLHETKRMAEKAEKKLRNYCHTPTNTNKTSNWRSQIFSTQQQVAIRETLQSKNIFRTLFNDASDKKIKVMHFSDHSPHQITSFKLTTNEEFDLLEVQAMKAYEDLWHYLTRQKMLNSKATFDSPYTLKVDEFKVLFDRAVEAKYSVPEWRMVMKDAMDKAKEAQKKLCDYCHKVERCQWWRKNQDKQDVLFRTLFNDAFDKKMIVKQFEDTAHMGLDGLESNEFLPELDDNMFVKTDDLKVRELNTYASLLHYYHASSKKKSSTRSLLQFDEFKLLFDDAIDAKYNNMIWGLGSASTTSPAPNMC